MVKTNRHLLASFIISSSLDLVSLIKSLSCGARQAYFLRDYTRLKVIGEKLIDISPRSEHLGRWFLVLANRKLWEENKQELTFELESLVSDSPPIVRAAAMSSLVAQQIIVGKIDASTQRNLIEASRLSLQHGDLINFIQTQNQISLLCSINGNHSQSLQLLRGLQPVVEKSGNDILKTNYYNDIAYELNRLGKSEAAKGFASYVLKSPHLKMYPEWLQTAKEIFVNKVHSRSFVTVKKNNVLLFPVRKPVAQTGEVIYRYGTQEFKLRDLQPEKVGCLCDWIDGVDSQPKTLKREAKPFLSNALSDKHRAEDFEVICRAMEKNENK